MSGNDSPLGRFDEHLSQQCEIVAITDESDLILVRRLLRKSARYAGFNLVEETKFISAGAELARNIVMHATEGCGVIRVWQLADGQQTGIRASFSDDGPGISDVDSALTDGFSTTGSTGLGLPGARRLVDTMTISTAEDTGTTVVITSWRQ